MIAEVIMTLFGWDEIWVPTADDHPEPRLGRVRELFLARQYMVGVWTGPDADMLCVRRCSWQCDADRYRSPPGWTILDATLRSVLVRLSVDLAAWLQEADLRQWASHHPEEEES